MRNRNFLLFVLVGGFAALVNFIARILISQLTVYEVAIVLAYMIGLTTAFLLSRALVFKSRLHEWTVQYRRFALVNLFSLIQVFLVSVGLDRILFPSIGFRWHPEEVAHAVGLISPVFTSYLAHKHYSFANN